MNDEPEQVKPRIQFRKTEKQADEKIDFGLKNGPKIRDPEGNTQSKPTRFTVEFTPETSPSNEVHVKSDKPTKEAVEPQKQTTIQRLDQVDLSRNNMSVDETHNGFNVLMRFDDNDKTLGIDGGRIARLTLTTGERGNETIAAHFDKGEWVKEPSTFLAKQTVMDAKKRENGMEIPMAKNAFSKAHDPDIEI